MSAIKHQIVIVGGGTAGIATAAHLKKNNACLDVAIIEPSDVHYYQPGFTFVGAGIYKPEKTKRPMASVIPEGVTWLKDSVLSFDPENNTITTEKSGEIAYKGLVVAAGIKIDWDAVDGLAEAIKTEGVCSNYTYETADKTWKTIKRFKGGTAIFTQPKPPFKCPGAAQKIMYLADEAFRKQGVRNKTDIKFFAAAPSIFPIKHYADPLNAVIARKELNTNFKHHLVAIDGKKKEATFEHTETGKRTTSKYDMIHVTPPQCAPDFLKGSPLANAGGWVDVDKFTLQSTKFSNVFALGDCCSAPCSKTAAAIKAQGPVVVSNLLTVLAGGEAGTAYDGYASCPLVTGYGKLVLAEFDYNMQPKETFPFDQGQERKSMYYLKKYVLPKFYWDVMLKGGNLGE
ncbi:MAG: FAD/NAD(P)-binding oxidoreductase [Mariprofundaceae bacterium]|nr:FAD/NAD(P)-binding oxidoreductase [Mariprofundaceae bacterium]